MFSNLVPTCDLSSTTLSYAKFVNTYTWRISWKINTKNDLNIIYLHTYYIYMYYIYAFVFGYVFMYICACIWL